MHLHALDWLMMLVPMAIVIVIAAKTYGYTRSVADFMCANRLAGRYLLTNAQGEATSGVIGQIAFFQMIFVAGFVMSWWYKLSTPVTLLITLTGFVAYRYRQSRVMTLSQFFEVRYSKRFRVFAGIVGFTAGVVNFGIFPAASAHFFVYFCGLPPTLHLGVMAIPTFAVLMVLFLSIGLFLTISGGWLTVMIVDCIEGLISGLLYLVVIAVLLYMFSWSQISEAMGATAPGKSLLNPFDADKVKDFNLVYVLIGLLWGIYATGSWQGSSGFRAAASSPHEAKMAGILGHWRNYAKGLMFTLLAVCAYTFLKHPDFAAQALDVQANLKLIENAQVRDQMQVPLTLAYMLPIGIKGILAAIMFFAMVAGDGAYMHSWGGIFIQDVVLPFRKKPFDTKQHLLLLRLSIIGIAVWAFLFSLFYKPTDYIMMFFALTGAIFAGAGAAILGGLYWNRGTTLAAWASMIAGSTIAVSGIVLKQAGVWSNHVCPWLLTLFPDNAYLLANAQSFPINGQWMMFYTLVVSVTLYVTISLLTCREPFNLDRMLHRGKYALDDKPGQTPPPKPKFSLGRLIGFDHEFTRGDKLIAGFLFGWNMTWFSVFVICSVWNLFSPWPLKWWSNYWHVVAILMPLTVGVVTTVWFTWGGIIDLKKLMAAIKTARRNERDDGMVVDHRNFDEVEESEDNPADSTGGIPTPSTPPQQPSPK